MKRLAIYGVFDRRTGRCMKVGSTIKPLQRRAKEYLAYKWFDRGLFEHRAIWDGELPDQDFNFLRAAKELMWIARMRTWHDQGGLNRMNPVLHELRNVNFYTEYASAGGKVGGLAPVGNLTRREHLSRIGRLKSHADAVRAGRAGRGESKARWRGKGSRPDMKDHPGLKWHRTPEFRDRLSAVLKGRPGRRGWHHSEEERRLMSVNNPMNTASGRFKAYFGRARLHNFIDVWESQHLISAA